eukprot:UN14557
MTVICFCCPKFRCGVVFFLALQHFVFSVPSDDFPPLLISTLKPHALMFYI